MGICPIFTGQICCVAKFPHRVASNHPPSSPHHRASERHPTLTAARVVPTREDALRTWWLPWFNNSSGCTCCVFGVSKIEGKTPNSHGLSSLIKGQFGGLPHLWTNPGIKNENLTKDTKASGNRPMFKLHGDPFPLILREKYTPHQNRSPLASHIWRVS